MHISSEVSIRKRRVVAHLPRESVFARMEENETAGLCPKTNPRPNTKVTAIENHKNKSGRVLTGSE